MLFPASTRVATLGQHIPESGVHDIPRKRQWPILDQTGRGRAMRLMVTQIKIVNLRRCYR